MPNLRKTRVLGFGILLVSALNALIAYAQESKTPEPLGAVFGRLLGQAIYTSATGIPIVESEEKTTLVGPKVEPINCVTYGSLPTSEVIVRKPHNVANTPETLPEIRKTIEQAKPETPFNPEAPFSRSGTFGAAKETDAPVSNTPPTEPARLPGADAAPAPQSATPDQVVSILYVAEQNRIAMRDAAASDSTAAATPYQQMTLPQIQERLDTAVQTLSPVVETLREAAADPRGTRQIATGPVTVSGLAPGAQPRSAVERLDASDIARFANLYQNALDKAEAANGAIKIQLNDLKIAEAQRNVAFLPGLAAGGASAPGSPGALLGMPPALTAINPLARTPALADLFPFPTDPKTPVSKVASSNDGLVDRIVMFNGLPSADQNKILPSLRFVEQAQFKTRSGKTRAIPILHNGYVFGKMDCSSFVSQVLFGDSRSTRLTTMDFKGIWFLLLNGRLPLPPEWEADRAKVIRELSKGFAPVAIDKGEQLQPGDLLVFRHPKVAWGHVFLVRSYDPGRYLARVMEASQSAGTIRERDFYTVFGVKGEDSLYYIPGLFGLRLKAGQNNVCTNKKGGAL